MSEEVKSLGLKLEITTLENSGLRNQMLNYD